MDNSTVGWGKAFDAPSSWRGPEEPEKGTAWGGSRTNPAKTGKKVKSYSDLPSPTVKMSHALLPALL